MGFIYLINEYNTNRYKIGKSRNRPANRLKQLQTGNSTPLLLISSYQTKNYNKIEKSFHNKYKSKNTVGEWFILTKEDVNNFIHDCKSTDESINILKESNNIFI